MAASSIEWTEMTWNPTTGCNKLSAGCQNCYAEIMTRRLQAMGMKKYEKGFEINTHPKDLETPYTWTKPKMVFVNSMSDLFHKDVPLSFIKKVFKVMNDCLWHTFQVLTKRADILLKYNDSLKWTDNIWMGVSVENDKHADRIDYLRQTNANVKFISFEPLLGSINNLNLEGIHWAIVGGESGFNAREIKEEWVVSIQRQCEDSDVAFFFKQWGGKNKKKAGRLLQGQVYNAMPALT